MNKWRFFHRCPAEFSGRTVPDAHLVVRLEIAELTHGKKMRSVNPAGKLIRSDNPEEFDVGSRPFAPSLPYSGEVNPSHIRERLPLIIFSWWALTSLAFTRELYPSAHTHTHICFSLALFDSSPLSRFSHRETRAACVRARESA